MRLSVWAYNNVLFPFLFDDVEKIFGLQTTMQKN